MAKVPFTLATQDNLDIEDIVGDIVILKDGSACMVLEISSLNFGLLSEKEQDATIFAYAQMLNSLNFSVQIIISSRQKDISEYLKYIDERLAQTTSPLIKTRIEKYREFIKVIVKQGNVLDKRFYLSLPFSSVELGVAPALFNLSQRNKGLPMDKKTIHDRAQTTLLPRRDHVIRLFNRIGLKAKQLTTNDLIQLFFEFYNRSLAGQNLNLLK